MKKCFIGLLVCLTITGCDKELSNYEKLENNHYTRRENSSSEIFEKDNFSFIFFKTEDDILISYEDDNITATVNTKNRDEIEMYNCKLNISTNDYSQTCTTENIEALREVYKSINNEINEIDLKF